MALGQCWLCGVQPRCVGFVESSAKWRETGKVSHLPTPGLLSGDWSCGVVEHPDAEIQVPQSWWESRCTLHVQYHEFYLSSLCLTSSLNLDLAFFSFFFSYSPLPTLVTHVTKTSFVVWLTSLAKVMSVRSQVKPKEHNNNPKQTESTFNEVVFARLLKVRLSTGT